MKKYILLLLLIGFLGGNLFQWTLVQVDKKKSNGIVLTIQGMSIPLDFSDSKTHTKVQALDSYLIQSTTDTILIQKGN